VRARRQDGTTLVEVAALDRSGGGDLAPVLSSVVDALQSGATEKQEEPA
jgi:cytochrome c biogenesis protein